MNIEAAKELLEAADKALKIIADINGSYLTPEMEKKHPHTWGETRRRAVSAQGALFHAVKKADPSRYPAL